MKVHGRMDVEIHMFFTSALVGSEWSMSCPCPPAALALGIESSLKKDKAVPVTGCEGPWDYETLRFPHFLCTWLTYISEVISLISCPPFTPRNSWYSFLLEAESNQGPYCSCNDYIS
jgi:hypothetical protein